MKLEEILETIKDLRDYHSLKNWHSLVLSPQDNTPVLKLQKIAKKIGKNHSLSQQLWKTKMSEAIFLAILIEEPKKVNKAQINRQIREIEHSDVAEHFCTKVVIKTPYVHDCILKWKNQENDILRRSSYVLVRELSKQENNIPNDFFEKILITIEKTIHQEKEEIKEIMLYALNAIANRNHFLNKRAKELVSKLGNVLIGDPNSVCNVSKSLESLKDQNLKI